MPFRDTNGKKIILWLIVGVVLVSFIGLDIFFALQP
jgi:hypothetical protein